MGLVIKTVKRPENVITRQFEVLKMLKEDSFGCKNYGIMSAKKSVDSLLSANCNLSVDGV